MRVNLTFELPDELKQELQLAADTSGITAHKWAAQVVENEIAVRRLDQIEPGRCGADIGKGW